MMNETFKDRFNAKVSPIHNERGCQEWIGHVSKKGYGQICFGGHQGKLTYAHRASWMLRHGGIPDGLCVLHRCDNPRCVNTEHLFLGTKKDNVDDMISKGRQRFNMKLNGKPKLTRSQVEQIRKELADGIAGNKLAVQFGVSPANISQINKGHTWK
jgi:hypothetical protein